MRKLPDDHVLRLADLLMRFLQENDFAREQEAAIHAAALTTVLTRLLVYSLPKDAAREEGQHLSDWMMQTIESNIGARTQ